MNTDNEHLRYEEELAAYLLDALPGEEARAFEDHLENCARCQEQARWLRGSVEMLPATVEQIEPPPSLRERLMETVYADVAPPAPRRQRRSWRRFFDIPRQALALGAVVLAAVAIGAYALGSGSGGGGEQTVTAEAQAPPGVTAVVERTGDEGILRVSGLPQRTSGIYQVWIARGKEIVPSTLFQTHRNGSGAAGIPTGLKDADQVMVTFEPPHGSPKPTRAPIIVAKI